MASQIAGLRKESPDYPEMMRLIGKFKRLRKGRHPFFLTCSEFKEILKWKLRGQYARLQSRLEVNTSQVIRAVTGVALSIEHPDKDYELELRIGILCSLRAVDVAVASSVLALVFPHEYCVIDFRGWRQVFDEERKTGFSVPDYKRYLREVRRLSVELRWLVQEVDLAIWHYDRCCRSTQRRPS
jgi:hypothetical protein